MLAYMAKRGLLFFPTLLLVTIFLFLILRIIPGDPALQILLGESGEARYTQEALEALQTKLGTDKPIYEQYGRWIWGMLQLDFGQSFWSNTPVVDDLKQKFPVTLELTILALLIAGAIAVPLGVISAIKQDTAADYIGRIFMIGGIALPSFWVAILMIFFLVLVFDWIPPLIQVSLWDDPGTNLQQLIFPAIALSLSHMAFIGRVTRSSMLEVFREDYIRTARSKGLRERVVISRHALKNALLPVVTVSGYEFGRLLGGTVVIENIFMVNGMGRLLLNSISHRDYSLIQGIVVLITVSVLVLNMAMDMLYAWLNPRIRYT